MKRYGYPLHAWVEKATSDGIDARARARGITTGEYLRALAREDCKRPLGTHDVPLDYLRVFVDAETMARAEILAREAGMSFDQWVLHLVKLATNASSRDVVVDPEFEALLGEQVTARGMIFECLRLLANMTQNSATYAQERFAASQKFSARKTPEILERVRAEKRRERGASRPRSV